MDGLKVGDRVWTLSNDGQHLIEDEIFCIPHAGPNIPSMYYFNQFSRKIIRI